MMKKVVCSGCHPEPVAQPIAAPEPKKPESLKSGLLTAFLFGAGLVLDELSKRAEAKKSKDEG
jgi:hypothetical protein